ncbi:MAG TPA: GspH/FimT family pseudopilin [Thermoanaerobaculia bacterium]|nr:GspH/FimT family pseudopilin [Thermoanaerobaculia bacterium]
MFRREKGITLIELIAVIAILCILALCAAPAFAAYRRQMSVIAAGHEMRSLLRAVRSRAIARGRNAGVKFVKSGKNWTYTLYDDGNGNGISNADIARGIDRRYFGPAVVMPQFRTAAIALLPAAIRDPDGAKLLPTDPALQFGTSTICSFSPVGSSTPGTIYISDGIDNLYAVRVYGATGKVRMLRYDSGRQKWEER